MVKEMALALPFFVSLTAPQQFFTSPRSERCSIPAAITSSFFPFAAFQTSRGTSARTEFEMPLEGWTALIASQPAPIRDRLS